jgi:hypothetical protein
MERREVIAIGIALQTQVLKNCPVHGQLYFDDDVNPASAFALAIELVRKHRPYVDEFGNDEHALTDLLSNTLAAAPIRCLQCHVALNPLAQRGGLFEGVLQGVT